MEDENERQWKKKWTRTRRDISSKQRLTSKKFLEVSRCSRTKERQKNVQKSVLHVQSYFLLIRPIVVFHPFSGVAFAA